MPGLPGERPPEPKQLSSPSFRGILPGELRFLLQPGEMGQGEEGLENEAVNINFQSRRDAL